MRLILSSLLFGLAIAGCGGDLRAPGAGSDQLQVVVTTGMVGDLVRNLAGDGVLVTQIMGPGVDPHLYRPTRDDVQAILDSDAVFYSGLLLEGRMADTFVKVGRTTPVFAVTELIEESQLIEPADAPGHPDPHVWMDIAAWSHGIDAVAEALAGLQPDQREAIRRRADDYRAELMALHGYAQQAIRSIPESRRVLVTSHDAFNYFGRAYGLEVLGVQGLSTESEAGLRRINELVTLLVERQTPAVFVETSVSPKNIQALVDGALAKGHEVRIGGELFSDAMGAAGTYEGTYLGMLDHNVTTVVRALGGEAPACGHGGRLAACQELGP